MFAVKNLGLFLKLSDKESSTMILFLYFDLSDDSWMIINLTLQRSISMLVLLGRVRCVVKTIFCDFNLTW
jgi:hypothetical protein